MTYATNPETNEFTWSRSPDRIPEDVWAHEVKHLAAVVAASHALNLTPAMIDGTKFVVTEDEKGLLTLNTKPADELADLSFRDRTIADWLAAPALVPALLAADDTTRDAFALSGEPSVLLYLDKYSDGHDLGNPVVEVSDPEFCVRIARVVELMDANYTAELDAKLRHAYEFFDPIELRDLMDLLPMPDLEKLVTASGL